VASNEAILAKPIPARLNLLVIALQLAAMFAVFYAISVATAWWHIALLGAAFGIVGNSVYSIIHEAEHRMLHPNARVNDLLGVMMALFFPAPYHLLRQGHLAHHRYNRSDQEAFDLYFDGDVPWVKWMKYYGIITGLYWVTVVLSNVVVLVAPFLVKRQYYEYDRHLAEFVDALDPAWWRIIRIEAALAITLHVCIIVGMAIPPLYYLIVYFGFGFSWSAMQYVHHYGTERHVLRGTRNLWVLRPIDLIWLHHNWHETHHHHPTTPWIYLPGIARNENPTREFLLRHYFRMWRGPRRTAEHHEGRFDGPVTH